MMNWKCLAPAGAWILLLSAIPAQADVVTDGNEAAAAYANQVAPAVYGRPADPHLRAQVALAIFEAVNAVERRYGSYIGEPIPAPAGASATAAAAAAVHAVLLAYNPARQAQLDSVLALQLSRVADAEARSAGEKVGREAARKVLARPSLRPGVAAPSYRPAATPGVYVPTDLPVLSMSAYIARPWFLRSPGDVAPTSPPPALKSETYVSSWNEVRRLGGKVSAERTSNQTAGAAFFASHDWGVLLRPLMARPGRSLSQNARAYALAAMAADDAFLAVTVAKFDTGFWRPITAIRNADRDGNDATTRDSAWESLLPTPGHPEFPCGHCIMAATIATVLAAEFGEAPEEGAVVLNINFPGASYRFTRFSDYAQAVADSRIHAGAHFRFSNEAAQTMGREIGRLAIERGPR